MKREHEDSPFLGGEWPRIPELREPTQPRAELRWALAIALIVAVLVIATAMAVFWAREVGG